MELSPQIQQSSMEEPFLSPNTKIARMLASIDEKFDRDSKQSSVRPVRTSPQQSAPADGTVRKPVSKPLIKGPFEEESDDAEDSEEDLPKPRGRAAARLFANENLIAAHTGSSPTGGVALRHARDQSSENLYSTTPPSDTHIIVSQNGSPAVSHQSDKLFVSPAKHGLEHDSENDLPSNPLGASDRLKELVAQKRAERLAREAEEARKRKDARLTSSDLREPGSDASEHDVVDQDVDLIFSDASRPARRASKKALLEMERETQRLARQQALTHQMKTKRKFTTEDLLAKFNFKPRGNASMEPPAHTTRLPSGYTSASSAPNSDAIQGTPRHIPSTPPSSPPTPLDRQKALVDCGALNKLVLVREDSIPSLAPAQSQENLAGMSQALEAPEPNKMASEKMDTELDAVQQKPIRRGLKLARLGKMAMMSPSEDSDDDLCIVEKLPPHLRAFEKICHKSRSKRPSESRAMHTLKHLSNTHANDAPKGKRKSEPRSINPAVLESQLRRKAKEQARQQQLERISELKAKGIEIQSVEEREKEAEAFEDLLEKARQEAIELRKTEKAAAKVSGEATAQVSDDEDEDESYECSGDDGDDEDVDGDKPEDENLADEEADETDDETAVSEAQEGDEEDEQADQQRSMSGDSAVDAEHAIDVPFSPKENVALNASRLRRALIIDDDEDDESVPGDESRASDNSVDDINDAADDPFAAFNFGDVGQAGGLLSPTQAFHATMQTPTQLTQDNNVDSLINSDIPSLSSYGAFGQAATIAETVDRAPYEMTNATPRQTRQSEATNLDWEAPALETPVPKRLQRDTSGLTESPAWEPTQDRGLPSPWTVKRDRPSTCDLAQASGDDTQSTVQMRITESPIPSAAGEPRHGKLRRRPGIITTDSSDEENSASLRPRKKNALPEIARKRKEALTEAERREAESEMRAMMDEQAEESEDEYAGLGGDDYIAPETEEDREMIDSSHVDVDERALAAHYAEDERAREEAETSRLYKDLTTGVLRRKMGASAFDLEEDEDELALRRRQMRQREEARKRKALLQDENIASLAHGKQSKGKDAFLKAIADDGVDDDMGDLSDLDQQDSTEASTQQSQCQQDPRTLQEISGNKRRFSDDTESKVDRPPAKQRRIEAAAFRRPTSLADIQNSVSFLLEEPNGLEHSGSDIVDAQSDSDSNYGEDFDVNPQDNSDDEAVVEEQRRQNDGGYAPDAESTSMPPPTRLPAFQRRTPAGLVDRLSLKRLSRASSLDSSHGRTAWAADPSTRGFKAPSLLRRATTSAAVNGANERGVTTSNGSSLSRENSGGGVRMGGTKKSNLAYQARAQERRAILEAGARRREENTRRVAAMRRSASAGGLLGSGFGGLFE